MKNKVRYRGLFMLILFFSLASRVQAVVIPDPNFRAFLVTNYPSVMDTNQELIPGQAALINSPFKCYGGNISSISGIEYFTNITTLEVKYNPNLTSIPNISALTDIHTIGLDSNGLTVLPNLSTLVNLRILSVKYNQLTSLPSLSGLGLLEYIIAEHNLLNTLPSLSGLNSLQFISVDYNQLTALPPFPVTTALNLFSANHNQLTSIPSLAGLTQLQYFLAKKNQIATLPSFSGLTQLILINVDSNQISTLPSLTGLTSLQTLSVNKNNLTALPDVSDLAALQKLQCSDNPLTSLPSFSSLVQLKHFLCQRTNISSIPDLNNCTNLEFLICTNNNVTALPAMNNCAALKELKVFTSKINTFPDLSVYPALYIVRAHNNAMTFEDLLPMMSHPAFAAFTLTPQNVGTARNVTAFATAPYSIDLNFDNALTTNQYAWYKDGNLLTTTTSNKLTFAALSFSDAGVYTCVVTNTVLTGVTVNVASITLGVAPCIVANTVDYTITSNECKYPITLTLDENSFSGGSKPFTYTVKSTANSDSINFSSANFSFPLEGVYDLIVKDAQGCNVNFPAKLPILRPESCDPAFYPNGDGVADVYYIDGTGTAKIYNRAGEVVKQLNIPANWDGTNSAGKDLPSGLYVIEINNNRSERVTLLR